MKATDLMIGDWVQGFVPDTYSRVVAIPYAYRLGIITSGGHYIETAPDDFQPIPLTPEILEKNGWERSAYHLWAHDDAFCLENDIEKGYWVHLFDSPIIYLRYVHELQHALRLCGIEKEVLV